jgi:hypothetical protein
MVALQALVKKFLGDRDVVLRSLQPEMSEAFQALPGTLGLGWPGVCRWCLQANEQSEGNFGEHPVLALNAVVLVQIDADVAATTYGAGHIPDPFPDCPTLPCEEPCPPPKATTDRLRNLLLRWLGMAAAPQGLVFCIPSKELETWIIAAMFPEHTWITGGRLECGKNPKAALQRRKLTPRFVEGGKPQLAVYQDYAAAIAEQWGNVTNRCSEARRFENDFRAALAARGLKPPGEC